MIEINAEDPIISIRPFDERSLRDATALYNSGSDIRYATGMEGSVPISDVKSHLGFQGQDNDSFAVAIYLKDAGAAAGETGGSFAGMITGAVRGSAVWLRQLSIMLGHRRKGLGSRAAKLVIEYLERSCGASAVFVSVVSENEPGLLFWKKLGFIGTYTMEKELFGSNRKYSITIMKKTLGSE